MSEYIDKHITKKVYGPRAFEPTLFLSCLPVCRLNDIQINNPIVEQVLLMWGDSKNDVSWTQGKTDFF